MENIPQPDRDRLFVEQSEAFTDRVLDDCKAAYLSSVALTSRKPFPLQPVFLRDYCNISSEEQRQIREDYFSDRGVAYFIALNPNERTASSSHPLFQITDQLKDALQLHHPLQHPLEGHAESVSRFGPPDGTVKIYDLVKKD